MSSTELPDRFVRTRAYLGPERFDRLSQSFVTVVGLGAVGSYAVEALARAGVGRLRVVDFDEIRVSNINRQLYALQSTLGLLKPEIAKERVLAINPDCRVEALNLFVCEDSLDQVLNPAPDLLIDAIDSLSSKVSLIAGARSRSIPVISSMGAAMRSDPGAVHVAPLEESKNCPLARLVRKHLRRRSVSLDFLCVYSEERVPPVAGAALEMREGNFLARGRERQPLPSLPTLTGIFGLIAANAAIRLLTAE